MKELWCVFVRVYMYRIARNRFLKHRRRIDTLFIKINKNVYTHHSWVVIAKLLIGMNHKLHGKLYLALTAVRTLYSDFDRQHVRGLFVSPPLITCAVLFSW